jgi:exonuclease SbcC
LPLIDKTNELIQKLQQNEILLRKQKEDALKIASLQSHRHELIDGKPCPLCGALSHPYSTNLDLQNNKIDNELNEVLQSLKLNNQESNRLSKEHSAMNATITAHEKSLSDTQEEITKIEKSIDLKASNSLIGEKISADTITSTIESLDSKYKITEAAIEAIQLLSLNTKLINSYGKLNEVSNAYRKLKGERTALYSSDNVNDETNKLQDQFETNKSKIIELSAVIKKESESLERDKNLVIQIKTELNPKLLNLGFNSIDEISGNILSEDQQLNYIQQKEKLNHDKTSIQTTLKALLKNQEHLSKQDTESQSDIDTLNNNLKETLQSKDDKLKRKAEITAQLKRDQEDQVNIQDKKKIIQKLKDDYDKWSQLKNLIGDATGSKFSNFAQGLTLKNLLVYANIRLHNLSDRYLLDMPGTDGSLVIIDQYQGNTTRSVNTLSGGESFLISLSLALSLSDMASRNASLDSLFIDEGFGTLDQDTLEMAMTTLEKLQSDSQKTVGIISHVEALKERIQVQIKLKKNAQGYSSIEVSS